MKVFIVIKCYYDSKAEIVEKVFAKNEDAIQETIQLKMDNAFFYYSIAEREVIE